MAYLFRPRLTPHQREVLLRAARMLDKGLGPVSVKDIGCPAAIGHLARKGYLEYENRPGPRGGKHLFVTRVHTGSR